ncbi:protein kinase MEC1 [Lachancea thermotolerans CBS 6340]|uniref:Serine/threonine-protein kinase MEC1 n=1 Tax=Lachancea thermotolerans (strain ATCC 56472 / CBS 6340 / NRRL Y-8284) TaxID=559295 RepID=C5DL97_LACTC|nr:KLTH0F11198p [Lachancea thermotolerans CBS 6340]CAR24248.1 KLTH0F11198p [Lachancea thermotolerans CBS 6340]
MESRVKYLDELVLAIKTSRDEESPNQVFPPEPPTNGDHKSFKVVVTLLKNLKSPGVPSSVFVRSLEALDLLFQSKTYLLLGAVETGSTESGLIWLLKQILEVSTTHWESVHYKWLLKQKVASWCKLASDCQEFEAKSLISTFVFGQVAKLETQLTSVFNKPLEEHLFTEICKRIHALCEWCNHKGFQSSVLMFDETLQANKWDYFFQRLVRIVLYVLDSISNDAIAIEELQVKFISLVTSYVVMKGTKYRGLRRTANYKLPFSYALETINPFLTSVGRSLKPQNDALFAKCVLRLFSIAIADASTFELFQETCPFEEWHETYVTGGIDPKLLSYTEKALILVFYDCKRRSAKPSQLVMVNDACIFSSGEYKKLHSAVLRPFDQSRQLENLRKHILQGFQPDIWSLKSADYALLGSKINSIDTQSAFNDLESMIIRNFKQKNVRSQVYVLRIVGKLACHESSCECIKNDWNSCFICENSLPGASLDLIDQERPDALTKSHAFRLLLTHFIKNQDLYEFSESLLTALIFALKRVFAHFKPPNIIPQEKNKEPQQLLSSLVKHLFLTPNRYIRLVSVNLVSSWSFSNAHGLDDLQTAYFISFLQERTYPSFTETSLMAWVCLTLSTKGDYFDPLLVKLIDMFNSTDFAERSMMTHQLRYVSWLKKKTPYQLLSPILPTLLKQIGKNLVEKKLTFQRLADFLEYPQKTILENFQRYIVPYAITQYKNDVITEISNIMCDYEEDELSAQKEKLLKKNSRQIFAVALVKHGFFSVDTLESLFVNCLPTFDRSYVTGYLPDYKTLAEILKLYKNFDEHSDSKTSNESMILSALRFLFTKFNTEKRRSSRSKLLADWSDELEARFHKELQENILGIFQVFSSDMHDVEGRTTYFEKLRVINGIHFLIKHASSECIISALAQISICLQTGQEVPEIRANAFCCWFDLIKRLTQEQLSTVIDSFVPFMLQKWHNFNQKSKRIVRNILNVLINEKKDLILSTRPYITVALVNMHELRALEENKSFARLVNKVLYTTNWYQEYSKNLQSKNNYLIHQSLCDVRSLLLKRQIENYARAESSGSLKFDIAMLLGSLLDASYRFRADNLELCKECIAVIGIIGVLDATKHQLPRISTHMRDVYDFSDHSQTIKFLIKITDSILVPAFWECENPTKQLFVALVMQESLKYCGLSASSWDIQKPDLYPNEAKLWARFNDISKTTLYPLRSSLYMAQSWKEYSPISHPSFNPKEGYRSWLKNLTLDLLKTSTDESHPLHVFSSLIREDDGFLSENLLPYVIMDILIKAEEHTTFKRFADNLALEFTYIFELEHPSLNHYQVDSLKMCYEIIFKVFEYCKKWITQFKQNYYKKYGTFTIREQKTSKIIERINNFLVIIPYGLLAQRSLETDSFERSALYLEQSYRIKDGSYFGNDKLLPYLQRTYAEIGDIDSVDGVLKVFSTGSVTSKIEELQYTPNWGMAQQCFEALGNIPEPSEKYKELCFSGNTKMLKSMYDHQQYDQVLAKLASLVPSQYKSTDCTNNEWTSMGIECAYLSGQNDALAEWVARLESWEGQNDPMTCLHYNFGKLILALAQGDKDKALLYSERCHKVIGAKFSVSSINTTLLKVRDIILKLHAIRDLWIISGSSESSTIDAVEKVLKVRLDNIGTDFEPRHFLLSVRKSFNLLKNEGSNSLTLAEDFFRIAQNARVNSRADLASSALIPALICDFPNADLEYAEVLWNQGENDKAIKLVAEIHQKLQSRPGLKPRERAKVYLKYTEWLDFSNNSISEQIIRQYNDVIRTDSSWSEPYYSLGLYFSRLLEKRSAEGFVTNGKFENKSISYFLLAFEKDTTRVREALPKVVTFWLDTAHMYVSESNSARRETLKRSVEDQCKKIESAIKACPAYIWYSVLTQLLSRLLHPHKTSMQLMMHILLNLATEYPSHILWYVSALMNSSSSTRAAVGAHIAEQFKQRAGGTAGLLDSSEALVKALTNVCVTEVKSSSSRSGRFLDKDFNFDMKMAPCNMVVPISANLEMLTPSSGESLSGFHAFNKVISIVKFGSSYKIFSSLKKPKKLNVVGSDGRIYGIMCKKEDVRQDNQYMQFSTTMDFLLSKDSASRKRGLGITTYAVMSLREDCGLIEIVPNVTTLRSILVTKYDSMKIKYSLKALHDKWQSLPDDQKLGFFKDLLLKFPPVLYQWFLEIFPDAIAWYKARSTFSRSYAVMAMVGHILGLGDRHCENILLNVETGKVLHVDFDCLFEKGKRLPIPEIVPFRLTHNLEDALGITGTEGTFKKTSQVTLELMRGNEVALVNIIETIMYDRNMDHSLQKALKVLRNKIRGIDARDGLVLSVAGQVETVIQESTSEENLSKMYVGWLPFW